MPGCSAQFEHLFTGLLELVNAIDEYIVHPKPQQFI